MANLSGEYDVVVEVGVNVLNGILGAVHENLDPNYPTMPRSLNLFVNDRPRGAGDPVPEPERTGIASRIEAQVSTPTVSLPVDVLEVRPEVGGARAISGVGDPSVGIHVPPTTFHVPRVTARVRVRAWVLDPTDGQLPEFIDGDLFVTMAILRSDVAGTGPFVTLDRTSGPLVTFQPAPGTEVTESQRQAIATIVRNVIRGDSEPTTFKVSLPPEVRHFDFSLQPEARPPSILLMLTLTDRPVGTGATDSVTAGFLPDSADFAVAVGGDFVLSTLRSQLFQALPSEIRFSKLDVSVILRPDLAGASFDLQPGRIVFSLAGGGDISWFGVDDHFTFTVQQAFTLQVVEGALQPVADGDPAVDVHDVAVGGSFIEAKARDRIREERDAALAEGASRFRDAFDVQGQIESILGGVNPSPAGVTLSAVVIRPDGVLVSGRIALAASGPVVVAQVGRSGFHDALDTFIPGGTIDRFVWEKSPGRPGPLVRVEEHRFVTEALDISILGSLCLRVEGTRVTAGGGVAPLSASACFRFSPVIGPVAGLSPETRPLLPLMEPSPDGRVRVIGHVDPWAPGRRPSRGHANLLVHFVSRGGDEALTLLREALGTARGGDAAVMAVVVVPDEAAIPELGPNEHLVVEDPQGRWADALGVSDAPATVLVGPDGAVLWKSDSAISAERLAKALNRHAKKGGEIVSIPIGLAVRVGQRIPDLPLRLGNGSELSLRRLKGRPMALAFWTSRSGPSLDQLEYFRGVQSTGGLRAPLVLAVGDGEAPERVAELVDERRFPFPLFSDADRRISRAFGVFCWPVTVWIRSDQRVEAIDFGLATTPPSQDRS